MQQNWSGINVFGLYELSNDGTVLYTRPRTADGLCEPQETVVGRDFFRDVWACENTDLLQRHFRSFISGDRPANTLTFDCTFQQGTVRANIFMTRAYEHDHDHAGGIVIMDIRQAA